MPVRLIANLENDRIAIDLKDGVYRIGRDKPADVVIPSSTVSGKHAELQVSGHDILLRDLGSTNGTFVNGERIRAATQINPKDVILLGSVAVQFEHPAAAKPTGPAKPMLAGPTQRMEAAREVVVAKMSWPWR
jgi:pSer/pThr/pTyr-binding forkhead associated (FHA) protein